MTSPAATALQFAFALKPSAGGTLASDGVVVTSPLHRLLAEGRRVSKASSPTSLNNITNSTTGNSTTGNSTSGNSATGSNNTHAPGGRPHPAPREGLSDGLSRDAVAAQSPLEGTEADPPSTLPHCVTHATVTGQPYSLQPGAMVAVGGGSVPRAGASRPSSPLALAAPPGTGQPACHEDAPAALPTPGALAPAGVLSTPAPCVVGMGQVQVRVHGPHRGAGRGADTPPSPVPEGRHSGSPFAPSTSGAHAEDTCP